MLKVNNKVVNFDDTEDEIVKRINSSLEKLEKQNNGGDIILEYSAAHYVVGTLKNENEYAQKVFYTNKETIVNSKGNGETWIYYNDIQPVQTPTGIMEQHIPKRGAFCETERFTGNFDRGLLYFMVFISPRCEPIRGLSELQNKKPSQKSWKVVLPEYDNKMSVDFMRKKSNVENKILNDLKEDKIRTIPKAMGSVGVDTMGTATVTKLLVGVATSSEEKMEKFHELCSDTPMADINAVVTEAIEKRVILTGKYPGGVTKWSYLDTLSNKADRNEVICKVSAGQEERKAIDEHMVQNPKDFEILEKKLKSYKLKEV